VNFRDAYHDYVDDTTDTDFARGLGWASLAIGLTELLAPKQVQNLLGIDDTADSRGTIRALGVRELCHGAAILTEDRPTEQLKNAVWSRVAGDVLDTAFLGVAATRTKSPAKFAVTAASVMAIGVLDLLCAKRLTEDRRGWFQ
jgi:hypothetical protein